ncbi:hypothetical protein J3454_08095 [Erythrobacter sp. NFXS35]|uniref:hypothetical protein n=1 Tax=Erythrobacter sp. NFXS35 TaxID=2818436 RepID=UPI0032DFAE16
MELALDPAALGGLAGLLALSGWAFGRMQVASHMQAGSGVQASGVTPAAPIRSAAPELAVQCSSNAEQAAHAASPPPCRRRSIEERRAIFAVPFALCELHDQVRSIRQDERIFDQTPAAQDLAVLFARSTADTCRHRARGGQPFCRGPVNSACGDAGDCPVSARFPTHGPYPASTPAMRSTDSRQV